MSSDTQVLVAKLRTIASEFSVDALARGQRPALADTDFARLAGAGFLATGLPAAEGGHWHGLSASVRNYAELICTIAMGDPSVALVASMHPLVLCLWHAADSAADSPESECAALATQQRFVYDTVRTGCWWGTITSEPGTGGDIARSRAVAEAQGGLSYLLSGEKHFGSGAGIVSFMTTAARVSGMDDPPTFFLDMRDVPWDGSTGLTLLRSWDGHGMMATQSHAFRFARFPATRIAAPSAAARAIMAPLAAVMFASVAVAIVRLAMDWARRTARRTVRKNEQQTGGQGHTAAPRAFETSELVRAEGSAWLIEQAYEGAIRAAEGSDLRAAQIATLHAKLLIAEMGEELLLRLGRIVGGGSYSRSQPLGQWSQDIRALGFLRPPWGLAAEQLSDLLIAD